MLLKKKPTHISPCFDCLNIEKHNIVFNAQPEAHDWTLLCIKATLSPT